MAAARIAAHSAFDPLWEQFGWTRSDAYEWLADQLGIAKPDCHMLYFDEETCLRVKALADRKTFMLAAGIEHP